MNETIIEWTDRTWNPASGCRKISAGCKHCYASTLAENKRGTAAFPRGFELTLRPHKLLEPLSLTAPAKIFVNSMSDLFFDEIPTSYVEKVWRVMCATPWHIFQLLTKRPQRMAAFLESRVVPDHIWVGTTIENQAAASRADVLRGIAAKHRFVSAEPLISPLRLNLSGIDWLIVGGESGSHLLDPATREVRSIAELADGKWIPRKLCIPWVRTLRDEAVSSGVAFFFKQWGGTRPGSAGSTIDGAKWKQFPPQGEASSTMPSRGDRLRVRTSLAATLHT